MKRSHFRAGFTVVEIVIVVAIVIILAGLLLPVVSSARENARESNCQSNLKQIYAGYRLYAQDNNKMYPAKVECLGSSSFRAPDDPQSLVALLRPYIKNQQIWVCPSASQEHQALGVSYMWSIAKYGTQSSNLAKSGAGGNYNKALVWDNYIYKKPTPIGVKRNPTSSGNRFNPLNYPHRGGEGANWLYADGHVKLKLKLK